ncbi:G1/S-specific cyclin Pcl5 [Blastomyces dermatitidis ATCC 18188]|uniref:G1/S-specific cyclin Pcl5 n=1 Tax=Ajellomyces dermatitidis (strain ATCC 18188 / CBS 674.68) TaxID=653446 RepID=F2T918_AJEDA|nr:G1/S-specific cyclin Pcl5 [Blastomyces dermatitidis ATCC 18188]
MPGMDVLGFNLANPSLQKNVPRPPPHPYASSIASSASSSSSSVFSLDSAQYSLSSSASSVDVIWENEVLGSGDSSSSQQQQQAGGGGRTLSSSSESSFHCFRSGRGCGPKVADAAVAPELRQNPRRTYSNTSSSSSACSRPPPTLVRQCDRKVNFVDNLVDSASQIVETIWPLSVVALRNDSPLGSRGVLPLRTFIQETLRRSRTSYSTLQVALYYLIMIKPHVPKHDFTMEQPRNHPCTRAMQCGRRMFLSALILASKYLQDRNYSARAWSKISGLNTLEINQNELAFLEAVGWKLHISEAVFQRWTDIVLKYTPSAGGSPNGEGLTWRAVIPVLTPELDTVDLEADRYRGVVDHVMTGTSITPSPSPTPIPDRLSSVSPPQPQPTNDQTPTGLRIVYPTLEPNPYAQLPSLPKFASLPTPQMTPQTGSVNTPAASVGGFLSRKPSICAAISQARSICAQRTTFEARPICTYSKTAPAETYPSIGRRSSLARSASSTSSPESMISDVPSLISSLSSRSSRSSRSSSISSVASGTCAPAQPRLATRATRRCANLQTYSLAAPAANESRKKNPSFTAATSVPTIDEGSWSEFYASPESFSTPISTESSNMGDHQHVPSFALDASSIDLAHEAAQGLCELSGALPRSSYFAPSHPIPSRTTTVSTADFSTPLSDISARTSRKRTRTTSNDFALHTNVREGLFSFSSTSTSTSSSTTSSSLHALRSDEDDGNAVVAPDTQVADSFLVSSHQSYLHHHQPQQQQQQRHISQPPSAISSFMSGGGAARFALPLPRSNSNAGSSSSGSGGGGGGGGGGGIKRACCAKEAARFLWGVGSGPGVGVGVVGGEGGEIVD